MVGVKGQKQPGSGRPSETKQLAIKGRQEPPAMPRGLGRFAQQLWREAVEALCDVLRPVDVGILRACCESYDAVCKMRTKLRRGFDADLHQAMCREQRLFESHAKQIGLTPSSRRIVKPVDPAKAQEPSAFDEWMKRGGLN